MRTLRRLLYFVVGLFLGSLVTLVHAETIPATPGDQIITSSASKFRCGPYSPAGSMAAACALVSSTGVTSITGYTSMGYGICHSSANNQDICDVRPICESGFTFDAASHTCIKKVPGLVCPDGYVLNGEMCTRPDPCPASGTGTGSNEYGVSPGFPNLYGWNDPVATASRGGAGTYCSSGCVVSFQATVCVQSTQPGTNNCAALNTTYSGATCTGTTAPITSGNPTSKPPCAEGEGVVTMGGKVACVPMGASPDIPKVSKNSSTQTFPDGSTKVTNTTTTCSGAGACSTTTTITNTVATSGPNAGGAGQAGNPGTTTSEDEESVDDEFCAKNPTLQMCKGGMSEEGTQKSVLAEIKKLTTAPTDTNFADGDDFDQPLEGVDGDAAQKLIDSYKSTTDALKLGFDDQNAPKSEPKFLEILGNWFDDVPQTGCEPPEFAVAGHKLDLSGWCPTAEKISNIGAYALWFMTLVGLFVMVTGGKGNT